MRFLPDAQAAWPSITSLRSVSLRSTATIYTDSNIAAFILQYVTKSKEKGQGVAQAKKIATKGKEKFRPGIFGTYPVHDHELDGRHQVFPPL
jgi:hypothetical protein